MEAIFKTELEVISQDIKNISELVVNQSNEFIQNPMHNEYMRLSHNICSLEKQIKELKEYLKIEIIVNE